MMKRMPGTHKGWRCLSFSFSSWGSAFLLHKGLDDLPHYSDEASDYVFIETAIKYAKISTARYNTKEVLSVLKQGLERARKYNAKTALSLLEMHVAKNEWLQYHYSEALKHFETGWSLAKELEDLNSCGLPPFLEFLPLLAWSISWSFGQLRKACP